MTDTDVDFSLENRRDYLFAFFVTVLAIVAACIVIGGPLYVFYVIGENLTAGNALLFAIGMYVLSVAYLYGRAN